MTDFEKAPTKSQKVDTLRKNLDLEDTKENKQMFDQKLEAENRDFIDQCDEFLKGGTETKGMVFDAISATAEELNIDPMEILKMLDIPAIEDILYDPTVQEFGGRSSQLMVNVMIKPTKSQFDAYREFLLNNKKVNIYKVIGVNINSLKGKVSGVKMDIEI